MLFVMVKRPETLQRDVAKKFSGRAMKRIVESLDELDEHGRATDRALANARWLLDWAEGKAPQSVSSTLDVNVSVGMHLDALRRLSTKTIEHVTSDTLNFLE